MEAHKLADIKRMLDTLGPSKVAVENTTILDIGDIDDGNVVRAKPERPSSAPHQRKLSAYNLFMQYWIERLKPSVSSGKERFIRATNEWSTLSTKEKETLKMNLERDPDYLTTHTY